MKQGAATAGLAALFLVPSFQVIRFERAGD
jgi:hypothetical protein